MITRALRIVAAVSALVAGYAHLKLYNDGYKDIPVGNIGPQFLLNAITSVVIAAGLLAPLVVTASPLLTSLAVRAGAPALGAGWAATSLFAFWKARTGGGWFGFRDLPGLNPSPEAHLAVFPEIAVLAACTLLLAMALADRRRNIA